NGVDGEGGALADYFGDAQKVTPSEDLGMQGAVQKFIDSSISKTINCPEDISFEGFKDVYVQAYELGCKGCTTYRPNPVTGAVLEVKSESREPLSAARQAELPLKAPPARPKDVFEAGGAG